MHKLLRCYKIYDETEVDKLDTHLNRIYKQLRIGEKELAKSPGTSENCGDIPNLSRVLRGPYVPIHIKNYITINIQPSTKFERVINGKNVTIYFSNFADRADLHKILDYENMISVFLIISLLSSFSEARCGKNITIYIFFTPFEKEFPKKKTDVIGVNNVNSGYSTAGCEDRTEIVIYRKEEWLKVLIHELFHNFNLDFASKNIDRATATLLTHFGVKSNYAFYETYCETWARILNVCVKSFIKTDPEESSKKRIVEYRRSFHSLIQIERLFSLIQASYILSRYTDYNKYREESNVFCYYVLTSCLMNDYLEFMLWCSKNNTDYIKFKDTEANIEKFAKFIILECEKKHINSTLECVKDLHKIRPTSLRMSII